MITEPRFSFDYENAHYENGSEKDSVSLDKTVTVSAQKALYEEFDAIEWVMHLENSGDQKSGILSNINDADIFLPLSVPTPKRPGYMPKENDLCVIAMNGMIDPDYYRDDDKRSAAEFNLSYEYLDKVKNRTRCFANTACRSSDGTMPFFDVTANGGGYIVAIGWTGDWRAEFVGSDEGVHFKAGLKTTHFYLEPGEKLRTSSILIMAYTKEEDKYNKFRRLIKKHFSHKKTEDVRDGILAFFLWGGLPSEEMKKRIREFGASGIRFEDVWLDAAWYGDCENCISSHEGDWWEQAGNWKVNPRVHPNGLTDVMDTAEENGMHLMLWVEPERAMDITEVTKAHPEWFLKLENNPSYLLNYGCEDALEHIYRVIEKYVDELHLSCYRQDFNEYHTDAFFAQNDTEDRRGITEIKHITGMYRLWDRLLQKFPHLLIDNCASGGRRIDIETLKRSIPFFRTDYQCNFNENPEVIQTHNAGISLYLPYNGGVSNTKSDTYAIRSAYSSSFGVGFYSSVFQTMHEEDFLWAKKITEEYRSIRKYFDKDFYNHGSSVFDPTSWAIFQYHDAETESGIVMAFRREASPFKSVSVALKGLADGKSYRFRNLDDGTCFTNENALQILLKEKRSSVIFEYEKI